ncbi:N-acetylmuramoyl-L-alanine amidase [[Ruminococcus] torques]|uniref:N-acetylmuramoyl-L-alanine amidase n=1 Tax=[Ruminococcus] torques TaxID=33039 RepID=UPI0025A3E037|nr:N-acetylmuramoyl-L-alanine amidase [[Ruminococcus] torques]MDM8235014.1 N-acetylmuramoyl-L-alanine amidase [[Ruminococcus] torques]
MTNKLIRVIAVIMLSAMFVSSIPMQTVYGMETDENGKSMAEVQQGELQIGNSTLNVDEGELDTDLEEGESMTEESMSEIADSESAGDENSQMQPDGEENEPPQMNTENLPQETGSICLGDVNYVYIESPFLKTPDTQRIVFSFDREITGADTVTLLVADESGNQEEWDLSKQAGGLYLFEKDYTGEAFSGLYKAVSLSLSNQNEEKIIILDDIDVEAEFGVNQEYDGFDELKPIGGTPAQNELSQVETSVVSIDENGVPEAQNSISDALNAVGTENGSANISTFSAGTVGRTQSARTGNIVVALDPGHDANDAGAQGYGLREEVLTLKIAQYCKAELEEYAGVSVYMTRTGLNCPYNCTNAGECIRQRAEAAAAAGAKIFVSFHLNASVSSAANGAEVIIPNYNWKYEVGAQGYALADKILAELTALGLSNRGIYSKDTTVNEYYPDGSLSDYFSVMIYNKENNIPGIIVEHAFISNSGDVNRFLTTEEGLKELGVADATGIANYLGLLKGQWEEENGRWKWVWADGTPSPKNQWLYVLGLWYWMDEDGYRLSDCWETIGGQHYYFDNDGKMAIGWRFLNNEWYYFKDSGRAAVGWQQIGSYWYWFAEDGKMLTGWQKIGGYWYYFHEAGRMLTGWQEIGGNTYYFLGAGRMVTGTVTIDGKIYEFNKEGVLVKELIPGWLLEGGTYYWINGDGSKAVGWKQIGAYWYWFAEDGKMLTGWQQIGTYRYYFHEAGRMLTGWQEIDGNTYYFLEAGCMVTGTITIEGEMYEFAQNGALIKEIVPGWLLEDGTYYWINEDGSKAVGWKQIGAYWYWFAEDGKMLTGWQQIGTYRYYFHEAGRMLTGWQEIDGNTYYFLEAGRMVTGTITIEGEMYEFAQNGALIKEIVPGWLLEGGTYYWINEDGSKAVGWKQIGVYWYWFAKDGKMLTGWQNIGGYMYYFHEAGRMLTGWQEIGENKYYFLEAGRMVTGVVTIDGQTYVFGSDGALIEASQGWHLIGNTYYYIKADGSRATGWASIGGYWYWFSENGEMQTGWQSIGDVWYYFHEAGRMLTGWQMLGGTWVYFDESGHWIKSGVTSITGTGNKTKEEMITFYERSGFDYPSDALGKGGAPTLESFVQMYIEEAEAEGIRSDVAFAQSMLETGYLQYGGDVQIEQFNFAGIGAVGGGASGASFADVRTGIRAHIQHLKAYANSESLKNACVDPRFAYVTRGSSPYVEWLGIKENPEGRGWATAKNYGFTIATMLERM